jgi:hypothetical protein
MAEDVVLICPTAKAEYFFGEVWTASISLIRLDKLAGACNAFL